MQCPRPSCGEREVHAQRSVHPWTEMEWPKRFAGINGTLRRRVCQRCGWRFVTLELPEDELNAIVQRGYIPRTTAL
jgi:transcriptional regulator NrdR family protein